MVPIGIANRRNPNIRSIIPLTRVQAHPVSVFLFDIAKIISNIPVTIKLAINSAPIIVNVDNGFIMHQNPKNIDIRPIMGDIHQYFTAFFTE